MDFSHINWLAAFVAALSSFLVGGLWYSKLLFQEAWMADSQLTHEQLRAGNQAKIFGCTAIFSLLMALTWPCFWPIHAPEKQPLPGGLPPVSWPGFGLSVQLPYTVYSN